MSPNTRQPCQRSIHRPEGYGIHTSDSVIDQDGVIVIQTGSDEALGLDGGWDVFDGRWRCPLVGTR